MPNETFAKYYDAYRDFTLTSADGENIEIHRVVLAASYEYFDHLFKADLLGGNLKWALFDDIHSTTLKKVIEYIYNKPLKIKSPESLFELIKAAKKFGMKDLQRWCDAQWSVRNV